MRRDELTVKTCSSSTSTIGWQYFRSERKLATMAYHEIDSFVNKFKALCQDGRSARLTLASKAGKAVINLRVDLGVLSEQDPQLHHPPKHSRNGPTQQRCRDRQAAARQAAAEQAGAALSL